MEEMFSTDRQLLTGVGIGVGDEVPSFPEPEPSTAQLLCHHYQHQPTALISPPPPQKLRPIRSNGVRNLTTTTGIGEEVFGSRIDGSESPELVFVPSQQILGNGCLAGARVPTLKDDVSAADLVKMKSDMDAEFISSIKSQISQLPLSFSSSSDGRGDSAEKAEEGEPSVKPKRRKKLLESFLEDLMGKVIEKQQEMHEQLMEMIEKKERERIMREEAWRQQEMERANKEQEMRSQEAARNLALLSFIQNALGQGQMPEPPLPPPAALLSLPGEDDYETDPNNKRWPTSEVQALITLRAALDHKFRTTGSKALVWEQVSVGMANMGYNRNAKKCKEKWDSINKYFKKATGNGKNAKSCPYFHELEALYRNQLITPGKANSPIDEDVEQTAKD